MVWKNISLRNKLFIGFGAMALLMLVISMLSYSGVGSVSHNAETVIVSNQLDGMLAQKEVDHLIWISKVNALWTDPDARRIDVQTDDHKCGFGKWLYGEGSEQLEKAYPDLVPLVKQIEKPHHHLHASVIEINQKMEGQSSKEAGLMDAGYREYATKK